MILYFLFNSHIYLGFNFYIQFDSGQFVLISNYQTKGLIVEGRCVHQSDNPIQTDLTQFEENKNICQFHIYNSIF